MRFHHTRWDWKGIVHYKLLPPGKTIDSDIYCQLLMRLKQEEEKTGPESINRKGVVFHHDNAKPHISLDTQQILRDWLGRESGSIPNPGWSSNPLGQCVEHVVCAWAVAGTVPYANHYGFSDWR
ncbi:Histone-lysine N-methyltransferase SETMAR [Eumeta japonica]|uniref:Histone-lysine N-methyltransferase SETMAR n=1 Tax=Eumeta variegata TaxID=151549 RepID=A0A4C1VFA1_EUMVA|nr:Histone-lysine N-methyltransferase SETMAR [Eumeta japonica]